MAADCSPALFLDLPSFGLFIGRAVIDVRVKHQRPAALPDSGSAQYNPNRQCMIDLVLPRMLVRNKKGLLEDLARVAGPLSGLDPAEIVTALHERERIGCTGIGHGVALPHARIAKIEKPITVFARLGTPIEYDAIDGKKIDLVYQLLGPEIASDQHLKALAFAARVLRDQTARHELRHAPDQSSIRDIFSRFH